MPSKIARCNAAEGNGGGQGGFEWICYTSGGQRAAMNHCSRSLRELGLGLPFLFWFREYHQLLSKRWADIPSGVEGAQQMAPPIGLRQFGANSSTYAETHF
jgi:hypothetical protein